MHRLLSMTAIAGIVLASPTDPVRAGVPAQLSIQGRLTDSTGAPLPAGLKQFTFKIFDAAVGGTEVWPAGSGEDLVISTDELGLWNASIGVNSPLTHTVFSDTARWLQVTVDDGVNPPETLSRLRLQTQAYSMRVATIDGSSGGNVSGDLAVAGDLTLSGASTNFRNAILSIDGSGSGLDADLLDGQEASAFALQSHDHTSAWTDLPLGPGIANYSGPGGCASSFQLCQYRKIGDIVYLRGLATGTGCTVIGSSVTIGTLPVGYRPPALLLFPATVHGSFRYFYIFPTGVVSTANTDGLSWMSLDGVMFSTTP